MKTTILTFGSLVATLITFLAAGTLVINNKVEVRTSAQLGAKVLASLQQSSFEKYEEIFPSLSEFEQTMEENESLYGANLKDAQVDFSIQYKSKLLPALKESFDQLLREGKQKGIDWGTASYVGTTHVEGKDNSNKSIVIRINSNGKEYQITIEKILVLRGQWRISQFARFS